MTTAKATTTKTSAAEATNTRTKRAAQGDSSANQAAAIIPDIEAAEAESAESGVTTTSPERVLLTVQQDVLVKAIETVSASIPLTQGHAALLDRLRLTTSQAKQTITLTGFNLIVGLEVSLPANVEGTGDWTVCASKLRELMRHFPSGPVTLTWAVGETMTIVSRTAGPFEIATRLADDCPTIPVPEALQRFTLANLQWGLKCAVNCAGEANVRCVHMNFWSPALVEDGTSKASVTLTSTKKEALLVFYYDTREGLDLELPDRTVSVAGESLQRLVGLLSDQRCEVELDTVSTEDIIVRFVLTPMAETKLMAEAAGSTTVVTCRTDQVGATNGNAFMPPDSLPMDISIDRSQMIAALQRQAVITDKKTSVTLTVGSNEVTLSSEGAGVGQGTDTLSAKVQGEPLTIRFDPELLLECLQALQSNQARLSLSGPTEHAYIRDSERQTLFFVLAPTG